MTVWLRAEILICCPTIFGSLIGTYLSYKGKSLSGPGPHDVFNIPLTSYSAALLLASSLFMVLALTRLNENRINDIKLFCRRGAGRRTVRS